jgi:hypothetical protein
MEKSILTPEQELYINKYNTLKEKSEKFQNKITAEQEVVKDIILQANSISSIAGFNIQKQIAIAKHAESTYPIMHSKIKTLITDFLNYKKRYGTDIEKEFYNRNPMTVEDFIIRLLTKRPITFYDSSDKYMLQDGSKSRGKDLINGGFRAIGTKSQLDPLILENYLSYDEMALSAFIGISSPTYFINKGDRENKSTPGENDTFELEGIYVGVVGPRHEAYGLMEAKYTIIRLDNNIINKQYGLNLAIYGLDPVLYDEKNPLTMWNKLFTTKEFPNGLTFPTFQEAQNAVTNGSNRFILIDNGQSFFDTFVYKERMRLVIELFLFEANERAQKKNTKAYVHVVGLGLGAWAITPMGTKLTDIETPLMLEVYAETIQNYNLSHISDINFSYFPALFNKLKNPKIGTDITNGQELNGIKIHFSKRNPADKLTGDDAGKLLVAMYPWDSNAYPGNEYWVGLIAATGDPAAAACSTIGELQNPEINNKIAGIYTVYYDPEKYRALRITSETKLTFTPKPWKWLDYLQNIKQRFTAYISPYTPAWLTQKKVLAGALGLSTVGGAYYLYSKYYGLKK